MNDRITAGAAVLVGTISVASLAIRWAVTPVREPGRHRGRLVQAVADDALLDDLMGEWEPAHGAALKPKWRDCPSCSKATAGVLNKDGWLCGECLTPAGAGAAS